MKRLASLSSSDRYHAKVDSFAICSEGAVSRSQYDGVKLKENFAIPLGTR